MYRHIVIVSKHRAPNAFESPNEPDKTNARNALMAPRRGAQSDLGVWIYVYDKMTGLYDMLGHWGNQQEIGIHRILILSSTFFGDGSVTIYIMWKGAVATCLTQPKHALYIVSVQPVSSSFWLPKESKHTSDGLKACKQFAKHQVGLNLWYRTQYTQWY